MLICDFCGEEKAVKKRYNPNGDWDDSKEIWDVCWECDKYIDWSIHHMFAHMMGREIKPFDKWLFEKEKVWPKGKYMNTTIKKMGNNHENKI